MGINISQHQGSVPVTIIQISGDLGVSNEREFQTQTQEAIEAGAHNILLDLSKTDYVSSSGLRAFNIVFDSLRRYVPVEVQEEMGKGLTKSPNLKLLNPSDNVLKVLKTAGYDMFLEIHTNLEDAIASFE